MAGACSDGDSAPATTASSDGQVLDVDGSASNEVVAISLPDRQGNRRETTGNVPHIQLDSEPIAEVNEELRRRVLQLPSVEDRESVISLPGATGLWLSDELSLEREDVMNGSREFAHIHPDGSLHVWLPVASAQEVDRAKWGELHPWVGRPDFWDGVAMIYTPENSDDIDIAIQIIVDSYNFITGENVDPSEIP